MVQAPSRVWHLLADALPRRSLMRGLLKREPVRSDPGAVAYVCERCRMPISANGRAVEARSIVDDAPPAMFHVECAPPVDSLRWRTRRELPVRAVRDEPDGR